MKLFANRYNRCLIVSLSAAFFIFIVLSQALLFISFGHFSLSVLLFSLAVCSAVFLLIIKYLRQQDSLVEQAREKLERFLSGQTDSRIECSEEGELFCFFHSVNTLASVMDSRKDREKQVNEFLKNTISDISQPVSW